MIELKGFVTCTIGMSVTTLLKAIHSHPKNTQCVKNWSPRDAQAHREELWGGQVIQLQPPRPTTAWLRLIDPMMECSSPSYRTVEVRNKEFELQGAAVETLKGKRKLSKKAIGEALSTTGPLTKDQQWIFLAVLYELHRIQTVVWDADTKHIHTYPEDLRNWSGSMKTMWLKADSSAAVEWAVGQAPPIGLWLSQREQEGWTVAWPLCELSLEEMKTYATAQGISVTAGELGGKVKKVDYCRVIGRAQAVKHLAAGLATGASGYLE